MTTFCATANAKWYAVNTKYMEARIDNFSEIQSDLNRIALSLKLTSSCEDLGYLSQDDTEETYITSNGDTKIWTKLCLNKGKNLSFIVFRADKNTSRPIIKAFHGKEPVKFRIRDLEFLVPTTAFNEAYKLLRD